MSSGVRPAARRSRVPSRFDSALKTEVEDVEGGGGRSDF